MKISLTVSPKMVQLLIAALQHALECPEATTQARLVALVVGLTFATHEWQPNPETNEAQTPELDPQTWQEISAMVAHAISDDKLREAAEAVGQPLDAGWTEIAWTRDALAGRISAGLTLASR